MTRDWRTWLFYAAGVYDSVLGAAFLLFNARLFRAFQVMPPNHAGYVQFPALLLIIFGFMFFRIARDPVAHRDLIGYGIALKASYSGLVFWYDLTQGVPTMWIPWAWIDLAFLIMFVWAAKAPADRRSRRPVSAN